MGCLRCTATQAVSLMAVLWLACSPAGDGVPASVAEPVALPPVSEAPPMIVPETAPPASTDAAAERSASEALPQARASARPTASTPAPASAPADPTREQAASDTAVHPPLEVLLRGPSGTLPSPGTAPRADLVLDDPDPQEEGVRAATPNASRWKERVHVESRSDTIGPAGPRQGRYSETDAGLRVPIDEEERVRLEGGVRIDQREEPGRESSERAPTPRVGVEVRF